MKDKLTRAWHTSLRSEPHQEREGRKRKRARERMMEKEP